MMASGDGRSQEWAFVFYSATAEETFWLEFSRGQVTVTGGREGSPPPNAVPLEEMIDSTEAVRIADANGGSAFKAASPGNQVCGAEMPASLSVWVIYYCPPFGQPGLAPVVSIDARTGEATKRERYWDRDSWSP
jgi:hypothetical protein